MLEKEEKGGETELAGPHPPSPACQLPATHPPNPPADPAQLTAG